ncbi:LutC/YkgG family protein [Azospirillum halopraeferens]|uniref:LutC/YkgG family protein n=1 Tax=Azospirillum halopraeferens TaxID=34010 RepID=UPI00048B7E3D|nr:lactate utilization protein C [Azospirillum halopraeferens]
MMPDARTAILARLRAAPRGAAPELPPWTPPVYAPEDRLTRFRTMMEAWRGEVHEVDSATWPDRLRSILHNKGVRTVLHAPATEHGRRLAGAWAGQAEAPRLLAYDRPVEAMKDDLVHEADAAVTGTLGGIAETGSLILWPTPEEPRLMSLLPPVHVALLARSAIRDTLAATAAEEGWAGRMPTNLLLVSGPSKTADIEQTLAFGVHGPKELVVLVLSDL